MGEVIQFVEGALQPTKGSCGLRTQLHGVCATISALADATDGISQGHLVETDNK